MSNSTLSSQVKAVYEALDKIMKAAGIMLNLYLEDEENEIELCLDIDHHLSILELRSAHNCSYKPLATRDDVLARCERYEAALNKICTITSSWKHVREIAQQALSEDGNHVP